MTNDSMTGIQAVQQGGDEDLLRQLAEVALSKLMAFEGDGIVGAVKGKPPPSARRVATAIENGRGPPAWAR